MKRVEIRPLPKERWHGKNGEESFSRPTSVEALVDAETGQYATGLTVEEAQTYGAKLGVDLSPEFKLDEPHPFYSSPKMRIKLQNSTMIFNIDLPHDFVVVKMLKASKFVATTEEWEGGLKPFATHVVSDEDAEVRIKASKIELIEEAISISRSFDIEQKTNILQLLVEEPVKGRSPNYISTKLHGIINETPQEFLKWAKASKDDIYTRAFILEAYHRSVIRKEGSAYYFHDELLGYDMDTTVEFMLNPNNQKLKAIILGKLTQDTK